MRTLLQYIKDDKRLQEFYRKIVRFDLTQQLEQISNLTVFAPLQTITNPYEFIIPKALYSEHIKDLAFTSSIDGTRIPLNFTLVEKDIRCNNGVIHIVRGETHGKNNT